jgi:hypothetical protein
MSYEACVQAFVASSLTFEMCIGESAKIKVLEGGTAAKLLH